MGCCPSREASNVPPSRVVNATAGSRLSTDGTDTTDGETAVQVADVAHRSGHGGSSALRRPNASLRLPKSWRSSSRTWTKQQLAREREIFWETQVTGSQQIWAALRLTVDMVKGDASHQQPDLKGAKAVMDAAGCTCPTGRLGEGVWDEQGRLYKLPRWVLSDPVNIVEGSSADEDDEDLPDDDDVEDDEEAKEGVSEYFGEAGLQKGKDRIPTGTNAITLKVRLSDRGTDVKIVVDRQQPVKSHIRRVQLEADMDSTFKIKLAYMGRILKESETLEAQGWKSGHVVNALVFNA